MAMIEPYYVLVYLAPALIIWGLYLGFRGKRQKESLSARNEAIEAGMTEPSSLHPVFNHNRCIGCGSCARACPEQRAHRVIGLIDGKSYLVGPSFCIGHGACAEACPMDAITLVYGTKSRGVEMPTLRPNFETSVPGVFVAGELGGAGLIARAMEKGIEAMSHIEEKVAERSGGPALDVVIVGAGPAGLGATLYAAERGMNYLTLDREDRIGGTPAVFPKGKLVMTRPVQAPLVGLIEFTETTKEELLAYWNRMAEHAGIRVSLREELTAIEPVPDGLRVKTNRGEYETKTVLLVIGRRGTPRKLGVPGEDHEKVVYRLDDPEDYRGRKVLVVGGGDSALEAATSIAEQPGTEVTLSYRSGAFSRAKPKNRKKVEDYEASGRVRVLFRSNVKEIHDDRVLIDVNGRVEELDNDAVIVCAGGILPTGFLKKTGIEVETKHGTP